MNTYYLTFDDGPYPETLEVLGVLRRQNVRATFFVNLIHGASSPAFQRQVIRGILQAGHALGNHGYDHDPEKRAAYRSTTPAEVRTDFTGNLEAMQKLWSSTGTSFPGFMAARLPGDGRRERAFVDMITRDVGLAHVGWDFEFAPNGVAAWVPQSDWQGLKGVAASYTWLPRDRDIILLHERHWKGRMDLLDTLVAKLRTLGELRSLDPLPRAHQSIQYPSTEP